MNPCPELDESLTLLAAEALEPEEEARVRAHLGTCAACRHELSARQAVLGLAAPPAPSARENALQLALPESTLGRWRRAQVGRARHLRTAGGLLAAAAVLLFVLGPAMSERPPTSPAPTAPLAEAAPSAEEDVLALEQWALADPLSDALDATGPDDTLDGAPGEEGGAWDLESDDFLSSPSLGESL